VVWNYSTGSSITGIIAENGIVYAASSDGVLYAFDDKDGNVVWSVSSGTSLGSLFSVDGYLYVGTSRGVYCFNAYDGNVVWNFVAQDFSGSAPTIPVYADGLVYFGWNGPVTFASGRRHNFYALVASTGERYWNYTLEYSVLSTPVVRNGVVYVGASFVTTGNANFLGSGAVIALKANVIELPTPKPTPTATLTATPTPTSTATPTPTSTLSPSPSPTTTTPSPTLEPTQTPKTDHNQDWVPYVAVTAVILVAVALGAIVILRKKR
jgi:outer membrane protein assembly factor BamB